MTLRTLDGDRDALQRLVEKMFDREEEGYKYCLSQFSLELKDLSMQRAWLPCRAVSFLASA